MWLICAGIVYCTTLLCKFFAIIFPSQVKCQSWEAESWSWHLRSCLRCSTAAAQPRWWWWPAWDKSLFSSSYRLLATHGHTRHTCGARLCGPRENIILEVVASCLVNCIERPMVRGDPGSLNDGAQVTIKHILLRTVEDSLSICRFWCCKQYILIWYKNY